MMNSLQDLYKYLRGLYKFEFFGKINTSYILSAELMLSYIASHTAEFYLRLLRELSSHMNRIDRYGNLSWGVGHITLQSSQGRKIEKMNVDEPSNYPHFT